ILTYWSALPPTTVFEGIQSLAPGHQLSLEAGRMELRKYWDWQFPETAPANDRREQDVAEELKALLIDAVRLQLRADVPVGAYLSGGLDSSIITTLIKEYRHAPLRTFSIGFE